VHLEQDEAAELLLGLDERPVGDAPVAALDADCRRRMRLGEALARDQHAGLARGLVERLPGRHLARALLGREVLGTPLLAVQRQQHLDVAPPSSRRDPGAADHAGDERARQSDSGNAPVGRRLHIFSVRPSRVIGTRE